jgi:hypothetical protein
MIFSPCGLLLVYDENPGAAIATPIVRLQVSLSEHRMAEYHEFEAAFQIKNIEDFSNSSSPTWP